MDKKDEKVDLVDSEGVVREKQVFRSEAVLYPNLYLQIVIGVFFDNQGRLLVHKRALDKKVNPGDIDYVCGGIMSGESAESAVIRESIEETGVRPIKIQLVAKGINQYKRFRYLFAGEATEISLKEDSREAEWVKFVEPNELIQKNNLKEWVFVDEFFEDLKLVKEFIKKSK